MRYIVMIFFILCASLVFAQPPTGIAPSNITEDSIHFIGQASAFTVGINLVTDGDFPNFDNWTEGTGWTVANNKASQNNNAADLTQTITGLTVGRLYRIQYEVTDYTDGLITSVLNDVESGDKNAVGVYTSYLVASGTSHDLDMRGDATFTGSISNVSMVEWVGDLNAGGGCTIASFTGDLLDYMGAFGEVLHHDSGLAMIDDGGLLNIFSGDLWDTSPQVGGFVNCVFSATFTDGIYEIVAVTAETITIDLSSAGFTVETVEVWIGGAYPDIATAINDSTLSEDVGGIYRKRYICVNVDQEVDAVTDFVAESSETALREDDGSRKLIGFYDSIEVVNLGAGGGTYGYRVVSDMDEGGICYAGAWQAFKSDEGFSDIRPNGKWIEWNAKGNAINILETNSSNLEFRNLKIHNTDIGGTNALLHVDDAGILNHAFINCWFSTADLLQVDDEKFTNGVFRDCYFDAAIVSNEQVDIRRTAFIGCITNGTGRTNGSSGNTAKFWYNCLFYKGGFGVIGYEGSMFLGTAFIDQTTTGILMTSEVNRCTVINCIFSPTTVSGNAILFNNTAGSLNPASANNIMYSVTAGAVLTVPIKHIQITPNPPLPVGTIEKDPQFVNPGDGNFRLQESSPAFNAGLRGLFGGYSSIGGFGPYHNVKNEAYGGNTNEAYGGSNSIYDR